MTTHTDRKSTEILAALDKLAENGMPFIDVVKQGGFASFPAKGAQPLPNEPVQIYEDSPFWNKVRDMAEHTDRIRQMAQEADAGIDSVLGIIRMSPEGLARFAQLVAEDCARIADESEPRRGVGDEIRYEYSLKD